MKRSIYIPLLLALGFALAYLAAGCSDADKEELFTRVTVQVEMPDSIVYRRLQATLTFQERNTGQVFATSSFDGTSAVLDVLKGYYHIFLEGVLTYEQNGEITSKNIVHAGKYDAVLMKDAETYAPTWQFL